jgi:pimeloyl-ACP methyl ester carboxylesterase
MQSMPFPIESLRRFWLAGALAICLGSGLSVGSQQVPAAICTDPPHDAAHPASMAVLAIPSGGVQINGVLYSPAGTGPHPTLVLLHGLPGNEKNLDLAQAVRRAGWNVVTFNYRGSWGSPGEFRFAQNLEDADAVLAYVRANADKLGVDTKHIVLAGHSMGGWVTVMTVSHDHSLAGAVLISAADMGSEAVTLPAQAGVAVMRENMNALAGVTAESMAAEMKKIGTEKQFSKAVPGLSRTPLLVLSANDGLAPATDKLVEAVRAEGNKNVTAIHADTDHSWSDRRIFLETKVIEWLAQLP